MYAKNTYPVFYLLSLCRDAQDSEDTQGGFRPSSLDISLECVCVCVCLCSRMFVCLSDSFTNSLLVALFQVKPTCGLFRRRK